MSKHISWWYWSLLTLAVGGYFTYALLTDEQAPSLVSKRVFLLSGQTTDGHHQIEMACNVCHAPFQGVKQEACLDCHGEELKAAEDSHPKRKFTDPRNVDRVALLDARTCITCHREHKPEIMHAMGVTQPNDFCALCHCGVAEERPSHARLKFDTCATAGCHNYHDNRALYEDFLVKHLHESPLKGASAATEFRRGDTSILNKTRPSSSHRPAERASARQIRSQDRPGMGSHCTCKRWRELHGLPWGEAIER